MNRPGGHIPLVYDAPPGLRRAVVVDDAYLDREAAAVRERLKAAGVRLGAMLNAMLATN